MNASPLVIQKREIRKEGRARIRAVSEEALRKFSADAARLLSDRPEWKHAQRILAYLALKDELEFSHTLKSALADGKTIALPRFIPEQDTYCAAILPQKENFASLSFGRFGILEPPSTAPTIPLNQLDFVLVPGVAFDLSGRRLGRGKGFYDRLLAETNSACMKCGVALEEQIVAAIPAESHDIAMNFVLTPSRWIVCKESPCP
jgi:5-formyltetrahydrofolate cyclo-ligase